LEKLNSRILSPIQEKEREIRQRLANIRIPLLVFALAPISPIPGVKFIGTMFALGVIHGIEYGKYLKYKFFEDELADLFNEDIFD